MNHPTLKTDGLGVLASFIIGVFGGGYLFAYAVYGLVLLFIWFAEVL